MHKKIKFPITILIVDDEPAIVEQLSLIIGRRVQKLFTASNGMEGYECYKKESPDLIISDIDMPIMNGIEFLKLVRADKKDLPFILSTGLKSLDILIQAIEHGITAFLPKPVQISILIEKIEEVARTKILQHEVIRSTVLLDQYKSIVDASVIVSKADTNGIITYVNDLFCTISGYSREELIGQPHSIVRGPSMSSSVFKELWETIQSKRSWHGLLNNRAKDGSRYTVKSSISPVLDNEGNIVEYMALREDVTELYKAQEEAQMAAKIKGDFLANMSHEIRTPMNGILGFTELLMRSHLDEKQKRYLSIIDNSTKSLLTIVNDILDFSKIESGKLELSCITVDPSVEFTNIAQLFSIKFTEKNIAFTLSIDPAIEHSLVMDSLRLQQIMANLLSNAIKFTPANGEIELYATSLEKVGNVQRLHIGVRDSGIGISPSHQQKIFEAFSQADGSTTRQYGGTGLGLSISSNLVSLMGGELKVESEEGKGSNFYFDINVQISDQPIELATVTSQKVITTISGRILIAEDNEVNQVFLEECLKPYNLHLKIVNNGQEAVDALFENSYDLLLLDINMPIMSGTEAIYSIRSMGISTSAIALTANAMQGDRERYLEAGFNDYLSKPIILNELLQMLEKYLGHSFVEDKEKNTDKESQKVSSENVLNIPFLRSELQLPDQVIYKLLAAFLITTPNNLTELKAAIDENDFNKIQHAAHKLRGSAGNMRMFAIEALTLQIEKLAHEEKDEDYGELYHRLESIMKNIHKEIQALLPEAK